MHSYFYISIGGGRTRLPKLKFLVKFPIGLHVILKLGLQIKKFKICLNQMRKIILAENLSGCSLAPLFNLNCFKWTLFSNNTPIRMLSTALMVALPTGNTPCCHIEISYSDPPVPTHSYSTFLFHFQPCVCA